MIQVELNGKLTEVSKHQLFALAKRGEIGPNTPIIFNGKESTAGKIKGIEFGKESISESFVEKESSFADQDRLAQYRQKFYGDSQQFDEISDDIEPFPMPSKNSFEFVDQEYMTVADGLIPDYKPATSPGFKSTDVPMASGFPHLAALGPMLMWYNFIFFILAAISACGPLWVLGGTVSVLIGLFFLLGWYLFWRTVFGSISDIADLAFSLYQDSKNQTKLLTKILESTSPK